MVDDSHRSDATARRPLQFTVRTFFLLAFIISIYGAAANVSGASLRVVAVLGVTTVVLGALYWKLHAYHHLAVLCLGPTLAVGVWGLQMQLGEPVSVAGNKLAMLPIFFSLGVFFGVAGGPIVARVMKRKWFVP